MDYGTGGLGDRVDALRIFIISPHTAVLAGLHAIVTMVDDGQPQPLVRCANRPEPTPPAAPLSWADVIVWHADRRSPGIKALRGATIGTPVVGVVDDAEIDGSTVLRVLRLGLIGVVSMTHDLAVLPRACRDASQGRPYLSRSLVEVMVRQLNGAGTGAAADCYGLTTREREVLGLLAEGHTQREIAGSLTIKERTVRHHLEHAYRKLGVGSRTEAVALAYREGLAA